MAIFTQLPEFEKELRKLSKKYPTIESDIEDIKPILLTKPTGFGKNFIILKSFENIKIVKVKIHCESLRSRCIRLIYSYKEDKIKFLFIEVYFKGDKENEDKGRIDEYLKNL
jgi:mRNA-degrading endonuclease RelE of RelBE toxin-antitoxin system